MSAKKSKTVAKKVTVAKARKPNALHETLVKLMARPNGATIRKRINRDEDCTEASLRLMAMRTTLLGLIGERNRMGGDERLLDVEERLKAEYRAVSRKPLKGALGRRER